MTTLPHSFSVPQPFGAWQGVATDGNRIYVTSDRDEDFGLADSITVFRLDGTFDFRKTDAYTGTDSSGRFMSFGDGSVIEGDLYVTAYNINNGTVGPAVPDSELQSRVLVYSLPDLSLKREIDIGDSTAESVVWFGQRFWVCYYDIPGLREFDSEWKFLGQVPVNQPIGPYGGYEGLFVKNGHLFANMHGPNAEGVATYGTLDEYALSDDGRNLLYQASYQPPAFGATQGVEFYNGHFFWADRVSNGVLVTSALVPKL